MASVLIAMFVFPNVLADESKSELKLHTEGTINVFGVDINIKGDANVIYTENSQGLMNTYIRMNGGGGSGDLSNKLDTLNNQYKK